jgi:hypothetical protein
MTMELNDILQKIKEAGGQTSEEYLTYSSFRKFTGIPMSQILKYFDNWTDACKTAGIKHGEASPNNLTPNYSKGKEYAIQALKNVANKLGVNTLSKSQFDNQNPDIKSYTIASLCGGWDKALKEAGLNRHENFRDEIGLEMLAKEFLRVTVEINKIPTVNQLTRRSKFCKNTFTRKFGSYSNFKLDVAKYIMKTFQISDVIKNILDEIILSEKTNNNNEIDAPAHHRGQSLGFRAFVFAPTYEAHVASIFISVADELGFEIISQREAFPDCEARRITNKQRGRYKPCLIEFEFNSSDYKKHKHPIKGCDLIVCWHHDWDDCPIEILELSKEIRKLDGWK